MPYWVVNLADVVMNAPKDTSQAKAALMYTHHVFVFKHDLDEVMVLFSNVLLVALDGFAALTTRDLLVSFANLVHIKMIRDHQGGVLS